MRRLAMIMLCLCLLLVCAVPAFAAEEAVITVTTSANTASRGDTIQVVVKIESSKAYNGLGFKLDFDSTAFEYVPQSYAVGSIPNMGPNGFDEANTRFVLAFNTAQAYSGELITLKLKVKADAHFSVTTISVKDVNVTGASHSVKGAEISCKHSCDTYTKVDNEKHTGKCTSCGAEIPGAHTWDNGTVTKSNGCETPGEKTYKCTAKGCGATKVEAVAVTGHAWDNGCDTECNNGCGTTRDVSHKYSDKYSSNEKGHWYACSVCGDKKDYYEHTPDREAPTETEAQACKYCGYVMADKLPHVHEITSQIQQDAEGHWYYCSKAGCYDRIDLQAHIYDNDCDLDCNVCGYIRIPPHQYKPEWRGSEEGHWRVCALCNAESEIVSHVPGAPATDTEPQVCEDCQYWLQWPLNHVHTLGEEWEQDEEEHWKTCQECQGKAELREHTWDEGTVILEATQDHEGKVKYLCTECQAEKMESVPALESADPSQPAQPTVPGDPQEGDGFPWWILAVAAGVLLVVGIVLLIIELIRSRKTNMHGKFSK